VEHPSTGSQATANLVLTAAGGAQDGEMGTPVPRAACAAFCPAPILSEIGRYRCRNSTTQGVRLRLRVSHHPEKPTSVSVEEIKQFPTVDRRRNPGVPSEQREAGEVAVFQELGKALTSSLQLDQVLRTIMEKIDEFLRPDNWSLLLLDEPKQELYFELAVGKASQALKDCLLYTSPSPRDLSTSRMPSSA